MINKKFENEKKEEYSSVHKKPDGNRLCGRMNCGVMLCTW